MIDGRVVSKINRFVYIIDVANRKAAGSLAGVQTPLLLPSPGVRRVELRLQAQFSGGNHLYEPILVNVMEFCSCY